MNRKNTGGIFVPSKYTRNFGNINNNGEFNNTVFQTFINNQDFNNAAEYLNQFRFVDNPTLDNKYRTIVNNLRQQDKLVKSQTIGMNNDQRDAYAFNYAINNNLALPEKSVDSKNVNKYTKQYTDAINSLYGEKCQDLVINVSNNRENSFWGGLLDTVRGWVGAKPIADRTNNSFYKAMGMADGENYKDFIASKGGSIIKDANGITSIKFSKSNPQILDFLNAYRSVNPDNISMNGIEYNGSKIITHKGQSNYTSVKFRNDDDVYNEQDPGTDSPDPKHRTQYRVKGINSRIADISNVLNTSSVEGNPQLNTSGYADPENKKEFSLITLGYMSADHAKLQELFDKGLVKSEDYNIKKKQLDDAVMNALTSSLKEYEVYLTNPDDGILDEVTTGEDKQNLHNRIMLAINNGDKINVEEGVVNGVYGTYIELPGNVTEKTYREYGNYTIGSSDYNSKSNGNSQKIFIPNFLGGVGEEELYRDPKTRAMQEAYFIKNNNTSYSLSNNRELKANDDGTFTLTTVGGYAGHLGGNYHPYNVQKQEQLTVDDAKSILAYEMAAEDVARNIKAYAMIRSKGQEPTDSDYEQAILDNSKFIQSSVMKLYDTTDPTQVAIYGNEFFDTLSSILGINIKRLGNGLQ